MKTNTATCNSEKCSTISNIIITESCMFPLLFCASFPNEYSVRSVTLISNNIARIASTFICASNSAIKFQIVGNDITAKYLQGIGVYLFTGEYVCENTPCNM